MILAVTAMAVLILDQSVKLLVRSIQFVNAPLVQASQGRLWMDRIGYRGTLWLWALAAGMLVAASAWLPESQVYVGLLLGGSLSNGAEAAVRGSVTDYVRVRFWPAFNLADVALTVGAAGVLVELLRAIGDRTL